MKKIPTMFERVFENHRVVSITPKLTNPDFQKLLDGEGEATVKVDGSCCAIIGGKLYKRYDCKKGKKPPVGFIPCDDPDKITGHWPGWVEVSDIPEDKWFIMAYNNSFIHEIKIDGTYEAVGKHFNGNPYNLVSDYLVKHGVNGISLKPPYTFETIKQYLYDTPIEGIVFWCDGKPVCKIKRKDFGFDWPVAK